MCVYYAFLLIIGNEVAPVTSAQTIFAALITVFGALLVAFIFGNMASLLSAMNKKEEKFQSELDMVS